MANNLWLMLLMLHLTSSAFGQIYEYTDAHGNRTFSNTVPCFIEPLSRTQVKITTRVNTFTALPEQTNSVSAKTEHLITHASPDNSTRNYSRH